MAELLNNQVFILGMMAVIVFAVTQGLKWLLIKPWTKKASSERLKKILNISILLLAFGVAVLVEFFYSRYWISSGISFIRAYTGWTGSTTVYAWIERFLGKKVENPLASEEGKAVKELIEDAVEDNKVNQKDLSAVEEFWKKVKHE